MCRARVRSAANMCAASYPCMSSSLLAGVFSCQAHVKCLQHDVWGYLTVCADIVGALRVCSWLAGRTGFPADGELGAGRLYQRQWLAVCAGVMYSSVFLD